MRIRAFLSLLITAPLMFYVGCGASTGTVAPRFAVNGVTNARRGGDLRDFSFVHQTSKMVAATRTAQQVYTSGAASNMTSLQFFITRIKLCTTLEVTGSGYQGEGNCVGVYVYGDGDNAYDTFKVADALTDTSDGWVDLMSETSIEAFAANTGSVTAGTYEYGIIENRKPVKLNAQFDATNLGGTVRTCTGGTVSTTGSGLDTKELQTLSGTEMLTCTRATMAIGTNGGGKWFKFQSPVTIEGGKSYILDLAFNPTDAVTVGPAALSGVGPTYFDSSHAMAAPTLSVSPVLRTSDQKTIREQYEIAGITSGSGVSGKIVLDLYYVGALTDVGTATIVGAQTNFVHDSSSTSGFQAETPYAITTSGSTITVENYAGTAIVAGLTRSTTQTAGGTQTITGGYTTTFMGVTEQ